MPAAALSTSAWFQGDGIALAQAIVRGEFTALQALEHTLADVQREHARLNAVALLRPDVGHPQAAALDAELAACADDDARRALLQRRPFFGVPLMLKDIGPATAHTALPSRMGSSLFDNAAHPGLAWTVHGTLTERYLAAGFVPFGRTTTPEMGISASTEARAYGGPTRNPFNTAYSAGGSSGGAAALVAAGALTLAHANDGAGSIRIPASACGLVGLKPSRGLMPMGPLAGESWGGLAIDHVVSRSVRDTAAALWATAGADGGAPYAAPLLDGQGLLPGAWLPMQGQGLSLPTATAARASTRLQQAPGGRPLRVALCNRFFEGDAVHPEVEAAVARFARRLEALGCQVQEAAPGFSTRDVVWPLMQVVATGVAQGLQRLARQRGRPISQDEVEPVVWGALSVGRDISGTQYMDALITLQMVGRRMAVFHQGFDLLLTPVLAEPPAELGRFAMHNPDFIDYRLGEQGLWRYSPFCPLANATGAPSIALPAARSALGLPIGALLTAPFGEDALLLQVAAALEATAA